MHDDISWRSAPCDRIWTFAALLLAVLGIGAGWPLLLRTTAALQIDYNEGWNAYRDQLAAHLVPLYGSPPDLEITNYPPLSFHLIGLLSHLTGDVTLTGRVISLLSLASVCLLIRVIARQFDAPGNAASCAGLLFAVWLLVWMPNRIGVNDPQLLGMAFEMLGFFCFIRRSESAAALPASALLFAFAVFTKHNLVALPLGAGATLLLNREWRRLSRWATAGLLAAAALFLASEAIDGPYFLAHMMRARAFQLSNILAESGLYLLVFLPCFAIATAWTYRNRSSIRRRPLVLGWLAAHLTAFVFSGGDGTGHNIFFEAIVLDAIIVVIAFRDFFAQRDSGSPAVAALLLALPMLFPLCLLPGKVSASFSEWHALPRLQSEFAKGVSLLRNSALPVLCENLLMCYAAGKPSAFDPFYVLDQIQMGRLDGCRIVELVESQRLGVVEIGDTDVPAPATRRRFTGPFMQALAQRYKVVLRTPELAIWMPAEAAQSPPATPCPSP